MDALHTRQRRNKEPDMARTRPTGQIRQTNEVLRSLDKQNRKNRKDESKPSSEIRKERPRCLAV